MMPSDGIQHVGFDQIDKRQPAPDIIGKLNDGSKEFNTRNGGIPATGDPGSQCRGGYRQITRCFRNAVGGLRFEKVLIEFLFLRSHVTDYALGVRYSQVYPLRRDAIEKRGKKKDFSRKGAKARR